jgi:hypothetical protein
LQFEASLGKKSDPILMNKLGMVVHSYNSSYVGGIGRIVVQGKSRRLYLKKIA